MRCRPQFTALLVPLLALSMLAPRVQATRPQDPVQTITFDAKYMSTQLVHQVDPDFPWTRTSPNDAVPWCNFTIVTGVDGTVRTVGPEKWVLGNCAEPYFSSAKRAVRLWTWNPQFKDGLPVQASFYVTVKYDSTSSSPVSILDSTAEERFHHSRGYPQTTRQNCFVHHRGR